MKVNKSYTWTSSHNRKREYSFDEIQEYFQIEDPSVVFCKKDFGKCKAGMFYLYGSGINFYSYTIMDWHEYDQWESLKHLKKSFLEAQAVAS
jgi:hypothetical protein